MTEERIQRKDLWQRLNNVDQNDWIKAGRRLGVNVVQSPSGTSHTITLRDPAVTDLNDIRGLITVVQTHLYKQANQHIFKSILKFGISENDIWKALKFL